MASLNDVDSDDNIVFKDSVINTPLPELTGQIVKAISTDYGITAAEFAKKYIVDEMEETEELLDDLNSGHEDSGLVDAIMTSAGIQHTQSPRISKILINAVNGEWVNENVLAMNKLEFFDDIVDVKNGDDMKERSEIAFEGEVDKLASKVKGKYGDDITGKLIDILLDQFDEKDQMDADICEHEDDSAIMHQLTWAKYRVDQNTAKSLFASLKLIVEDHQQEEEALAAFKDQLKDHQQKKKQSQQKQSQQNPGSSRTRAAAIQRATPKQNDERPSNAMIGEYESKEFDDVSKVKAAPATKDKKAAKKANSKADDSDEEGSSFDDSSHSDDEKEDVSKVKEEALAVLKKDHQLKQLRLLNDKYTKEAESKVKAAPAKKDKKAGWNPIQKMTAALRRRDAANALGEFMRSEDEEL